MLPTRRSTAVDGRTDSFQKRLDSTAGFLWTDPSQAFLERTRASHETIRDSTAVDGRTDSFQKRLDSTAGFLWTDPSQAFLERARASHETIRDSTAVGGRTDSFAEASRFLADGYSSENLAEKVSTYCQHLLRRFEKYLNEGSEFDTSAHAWVPNLTLCACSTFRFHGSELVPNFGDDRGTRSARMTRKFVKRSKFFSSKEPLHVQYI